MSDRFERVKNGTAEALRELPWPSGLSPLMLAPMQGVTNRALRSLFIEWVRPDVVFTEFMRVHSESARRRLSAGDLREAAAAEGGVPLVVQLIGHGREALVSAARAAEAAGARHINLNMGCPYGRMTKGLTGGGMLREPEKLAEIIPALRGAISGTFSVKMRAGYEDSALVHSLIPLLEGAGVDFLVLHPRTVIQQYTGRADHAVTAEVVRRTRLPVIANGDIRSAVEGLRILRETGAAGLMLGRGAVADPLLFERLRGREPAEPERRERAAMLRRYLGQTLERYGELFCGEAQVLGKVKEVLAFMDDPDFGGEIRQMKKARRVDTFAALIEELA
ncbi:tRNA-dihydrouridine synthase [Desulfuromonas sp. TF]|uniref:tRNA dihydrouridine synthase n=1 Tax=Desulfuromonas sp. TF TaxID=1232410 RepID=UPI001D05856C|nr:tRNA-dihydrouridine synthase family protein [Desulfuromonas sp. TF]